MLNTVNNNNKNSKKIAPIQSLERGLILLDYVAGAQEPVPLTELAKLLSIEKSSAHRLLATLLVHGYVLQNSKKRYITGPGVMRLASRSKNRLAVHEIAGPYLNRLAAKTGETAHLGVLGRDGVVLTNCVSSNHALAVTSHVGEVEPLHCSALGKALICDFELEELRAIIGDDKLRKYTINTLASIRSLHKQCKQVRNKKIAVDDQEFRAGVKCFAAPIRDSFGKIVAAIGISGPISRLSEKTTRKVSNLVKNTGIEVSKQLGFTFEEFEK
jgi:DNA-binding IclR family transcriptional regulator